MKGRTELSDEERQRRWTWRFLVIVMSRLSRDVTHVCDARDVSHKPEIVQVIIINNSVPLGLWQAAPWRYRISLIVCVWSLAIHEYWNYL